MSHQAQRLNATLQRWLSRNPDRVGSLVTAQERMNSHVMEATSKSGLLLLEANAVLIQLLLLVYLKPFPAPPVVWSPYFNGHPNAMQCVEILFPEHKVHFHG